MANFIYDKAADALWAGQIAFDTDAIKAVLVDAASYTPDQVNHQFLSDIPLAARAAVSSNLTTKTISGRAIDADDVTFTAVPSGPALSYVVLYQDTGVETTSRLLLFIDTATGLPVTPNGGDITIQWDAQGIAKL